MFWCYLCGRSSPSYPTLPPTHTPFLSLLQLSKTPTASHRRPLPLENACVVKCRPTQCCQGPRLQLLSPCVTAHRTSPQLSMREAGDDHHNYDFYDHRNYDYFGTLLIRGGALWGPLGGLWDPPMSPLRSLGYSWRPRGAWRTYDVATSATAKPLRSNYMLHVIPFQAELRGPGHT